MNIDIMLFKSFAQPYFYRYFKNNKKNTNEIKELCNTEELNNIVNDSKSFIKEEVYVNFINTILYPNSIKEYLEKDYYTFIYYTLLTSSDIINLSSSSQLWMKDDEKLFQECLSSKYMITNNSEDYIDSKEIQSYILNECGMNISDTLYKSFISKYIVCSEDSIDNKVMQRGIKYLESNGSTTILM